MTFDEYAKQAITTDVSKATLPVPLSHPSFMDKILGLVGEAGEVAEKVKKLLRDKQGEMDDTSRQDMAKELGDVLWYLSAVSHYLGVSLDSIASDNLAKLQDRQGRNTLKGSGDNR